MEKKDTLSSCSESEEQQMQLIQDKSQESCIAAVQFHWNMSKSIDERALHKMEYDSRVNERQTQTTVEKVDTGKELDASLVIIESNGTESQEADTKRRSEELSTYAIETINIELEHKVAKLLKENKTLKRHYKEMFDSIKTTRAKNIEHTTSLIANNDKFKAQLQEKGFAIAALKNSLRKLTGNSVNTKFAKPSILGNQWVPTGKIFTSSTTKVDSEPPNGSKEDITNQCESEQALDVSAGTLLSTADQASVFMAMTSDHNRSELGIHDHSNEPSSSKLVPKVVPLAVKTAISRQD
ncbi:hypothetical protein Tco_0528807 [Tanacetum coccineum]